jgi:hypothetical protein
MMLGLERERVWAGNWVTTGGERRGERLPTVSAWSTTH